MQALPNPEELSHRQITIRESYGNWPLFDWISEVGAAIL